jgi:hypothetical protein
MTDEQINAAIAEACGWEDVAPLKENLNVWIGKHGGYYQNLEEYCTDLNAMNEAEETLTEEQRNFMFNYLMSIRWINASEGERRGLGTQKKLSPARATARQRAEAFLRTLGKWEEGE